MSCNLGQQTKKTARVRNLISACLMAVTFFTASVFAKDRRPGLQVIAEVKHDTSLSLRDMESSIASQATAAPRRVMPLLLPHPATGEASVQADTALQKVDLPFVSASLGLNFDGLGQGQNGFVVNAAPPDTNGVVGATQYVQWVKSAEVRSGFHGGCFRCSLNASAMRPDVSCQPTRMWPLRTARPK